MVLRGHWIGLILALLFFCGSSEIKAQQWQYSEPEAFDFRNSDYAVVGNIGDQYYAYRGSEEGQFLDIFQSGMEKQATVILDFISGRLQKIRFYVRNQQIMVVYQLSEGRNQVAYAARLDAQGRLEGRPARIATVEGRRLAGGRPEFFMVASEDREQVVVYYIEGSSQGMELSLYWVPWESGAARREHRRWEDGGDYTPGSAMVSNTGDFYLSAYLSVGNAGFAEELHLIRIRPSDQGRKGQPLSGEEVYSLSLEQRLAAGTHMKLDNGQNRVFVAGFYAERKKGNLEGVFSTVLHPLDKGMESEAIQWTPFDESLRLATGDRRRRKALNAYQVRDLIVKNDGGFVLVAEDYFVTTRHGYSPGFGYYSWYYPSMGSSVREYHYGDILIISYDGAGSREWYQFIRKDQYTQEDRGLFSSFLMINTGGAIGFLYNDFAGSRVRLASLDGSGQVRSHALGEESASSPDWVPRYGRQVSAREVMVPCLMRRRICFAKLSF